MNGNTKNKFIGGVYGAIIALFLAFIGFVFGYGILCNRVDALETKTNCIIQINDRLARIETDINWIKENNAQQAQE